LRDNSDPDARSVRVTFHTLSKAITLNCLIGKFAMSEPIKVASFSEIEDGGRLSVIVDDIPALLLRVGETIYCIEDVCTHDGQPLTDGPLNGCEITCPRHGARFDIRTGAALCMPATEPVRTFDVELRGEEIWVAAE
jgi:3-phenylpropionate/trans-cinnamate dioxygenase ferredoxin subunit